MTKQKNKSDFLVNGQPKYADVVKANDKAVGYNLGKSQANLLEQQKKLVEQQSMMNVQQMMMMQKEDELRKVLSEINSAINQMAPPPMPDALMGEQMMSPEMAMGGMPPAGAMPPDMGGMTPDMQGQQGFI
jgi:hypothetical protein